MPTNNSLRAIIVGCWPALGVDLSVIICLKPVYLTESTVSSNI